MAGLEEFAPVFAGEFRQSKAELTANGGRSKIEHVRNLGLDGDDETRGFGFETVVTVVGLNLSECGSVGRAAVECGEAGRIPAPAPLFGSGAGKDVFGGGELDGLKPEKVSTLRGQPFQVCRQHRPEFSVAGGWVMKRVISRAKKTRMEDGVSN
jgi:hypothetical protein